MVKIDASQYETNWLTDETSDGSGSPEEAEAGSETGSNGAESDTPTANSEQKKQAVEALKAALNSDRGNIDSDAEFGISRNTTQSETTEKEWVPYRGPQGGVGWQNNQDPDDIRYVDEPPGEVIDAFDFIDDVDSQEPVDSVSFGGGSEEGVGEGPHTEAGSTTNRLGEIRRGPGEGWRKVQMSSEVLEEELDARSVSLAKADEGHALETANIVGVLNDHNPQQIDPTTFYLRPPELRPEASGAYDWRTQRLEVHPEQGYDAAIQKQRYSNRTRSSGHPYATLIHELGHLAHQRSMELDEGVNVEWRESIKEGIDGVEDALPEGKGTQDVVQEVSSYATTNPLEYVSEVWTGALTGHEYPDWVWGVYDEFDGPDVPDVTFGYEMEGKYARKQAPELPDELVAEAQAVWQSFLEWSEETEKSVAKEWIPYEGPQGGEGWQRVSDGEVRYQPDPPGEIEEGYEDMAEGWGEEADRVTSFRQRVEDAVSEDEAYYINHSRVKSELDDEIGGWNGGTWTGIEVPKFRDDIDMTIDIATSLLRADEHGLFDGVAAVSAVDPGSSSDHYHAKYIFPWSKLRLDNDFTDETLEEYYEEGHTVGKDTEWLILHELGHHQHKLSLEDDERSISDLGDSLMTHNDEWDEDLFRTADEQVSSYARSSPTEFVAEVFSGLCMGIDYGDDVMERYREYGGPDTWQQYRENVHPGDPKVPRKDRREVEKSLPRPLQEEAEAVWESFVEWVSEGGVTEKNWIPYEGPKGGEGWQNVESGEVRYQQDPPGEVEEGYQSDHWAGSDDTVMPDWHEDADRPPWPEDPVFLEDPHWLNETSVVRVERDGEVFEGFPLADSDETPGFWPAAIWTKDGEVVPTPFEDTEYLAADVRSSSASYNNIGTEWSEVEWEHIPEEIAPSEEDLSPWERTSDVFGREMWINPESGAVSYADELPEGDEGERVEPPWPEDPTFNPVEDYNPSGIRVGDLVQVRADDGEMVEGYLLDTDAQFIWTEDGDVVDVGTGAEVVGESIATAFDQLDSFPEYDPEEHRDPYRPGEHEEEWVDPQLNDDVGSEDQSGNHVDERGVVHTEQEDRDTDEWEFPYRDPRDMSADDAFTAFRDKTDRETWKPVDDAVASWVNSPSYASEMQEAAELLTGNEKGVRDDPGTDAEALQAFSDFTTAFLKEQGHDTLTLYRFVDDAIADEILERDMEVSPRAASSWSESMGAAAETAETVRHTNEDGLILEAEVPAENVLASHRTHDVFNNREEEAIVALPEDIDLTDLKYHGHGQYDPNTEKAVATVRKNWIPYRGPQGGEGWQNTQDPDDIRYGLDEPPGRVAAGYEADHWSGEQATTQSEGEMGYVSEGADGASLDVTTADRAESLAEAGASEGASSRHMHVATWEDEAGNVTHRAFVTNYGPDTDRNRTGEKPFLGERAVAADAFLRAAGFGENAPKHFLNRQQRYLAVEGVEGEEARHAPDEWKEQVDEERAKDFAAATMLMGNSDLHPKNILLNENGEFVAVDLDKSGGDFVNGPERFKRRGVQSIQWSMKNLGASVSKDELNERAQRLAEELDVEQVLDSVPNSVWSDKDRHQFRDNIRNNIEAAREGRLL